MNLGKLGLINTYSEAVADLHVQASGWVQNLTLPGGALTRTFASPLAFDGKRAPLPKSPPRLDEDRGAILAMIGEPEAGPPVFDTAQVKNGIIAGSAS